MTRCVSLVGFVCVFAMLGNVGHCQHALPDFHIEDNLELFPPVPPHEQTPPVSTHWHTPGGWWRRACHQLETNDFGFAPNWVASAELLALRRDLDGPQPFATLGAGGPIVLELGDLHDEFDAGVRVMLGKAIGEWYRLELMYYGSYSWDHAAAIRNTDPNALGGAGNLFSPFSDFGNAVGGGINGLDFNNLASISYESEMDNFEFNLRRRIKVCPGPWALSFLFGGRLMRVDEQFNYLTVADVPAPQGAVNDVRVAAGNLMAGMQLGLQLQYMIVPRGFIDFEIKGVIFANETSHTTNYRNVNENGVETVVGGRAVEQTTAYMGDMTLTFNYHFNRYFTFRAGYNVLFMEGLAIASENFETNPNLLRLGPRDVEHSGRVVYHGPSLGFVFAW